MVAVAGPQSKEADETARRKGQLGCAVVVQVGVGLDVRHLRGPNLEIQYPSLDGLLPKCRRHPSRLRRLDPKSDHNGGWPAVLAAVLTRRATRRPERAYLGNPPLVTSR